MSDDLDMVEQDGGDDGGGWLATFADLMALLMCFFVLLLSFSEMEMKKYKQVAGSMSEAFGVQREINAKESPKGTSIIAQEFSPGKPTQSFTVVMQQESTDQNKQNLDFSDSDFKGKAEETAEEQKDPKEAPSEEPPPIDPAILEAAKMIAQALNDEIEMGMVEVLATPDRVAIRVREKGSFESGSAQLSPSFFPTLSKITGTLKDTQGEVVVAGHTDNVPITTARFPSNWELSSARAAAFVHFMTKKEAFEGERLQIRAFAETRPIEPNTTADNRAANRRVEISLVLPVRNVANVSNMVQKIELPADTPDVPPVIPEPPARDMSHTAQ
ncbi:MAG: MotB family protein [Lysobacterales bacterium]